jgi:excisionase family DNA binding protein
VQTDQGARGFTPRELARVLRVSADRVRQWIQTGELGAINTSTFRCAKPRYVVLPHHLAEFERTHKAGPTAKPPLRRRRQLVAIDYYPES